MLNYILYQILISIIMTSYVDIEIKLVNIYKNKTACRVIIYNK